MPKTERDELLSPAELAEWLGIRLGTLYEWRYRKRGPTSVKVGSLIRYRRRDVEAWIEEQKQTSRP